MSESDSVNVISDKMLALVHDATNAAYNRACATEWGRGVKAAILAEKQTETALVEAIAELEAENAALKAKLNAGETVDEWGKPDWGGKDVRK